MVKSMRARVLALISLAVPDRIRPVLDKISGLLNCGYRPVCARDDRYPDRDRCLPRRCFVTKHLWVCVRVFLSGARTMSVRCALSIDREGRIRERQIRTRISSTSRLATVGPMKAMPTGMEKGLVGPFTRTAPHRTAPHRACTHRQARTHAEPSTRSWTVPLALHRSAK